MDRMKAMRGTIFKRFEMFTIFIFWIMFPSSLLALLLKLKKSKTFMYCSHHTRYENSTCVMVDGRGGALKPGFTSKIQMIMDCEVECSTTVNIIIITINFCRMRCATHISFICAYFLIKYRTQNNNGITTQ